MGARCAGARAGSSRNQRTRPPENATVILLLHGSADTPQAWSAVAQRLGPSVAVVAPALPPIQTPLALDTDLPWLTEVMATTGARTLGGHSYGALLALRWALAHPGQLDRLVLAEP
ncbi:MAG: alpha/beta fold hydrolase, partial [Myxococcales bacterium]|nr:alpha/beta fold hydrolase [Myxococcales bacterium]